MTEVNIFELPIVPNEEIKDKEAFIFEDRIECHPDFVEMLREGLLGLQQGEGRYENNNPA